MERISREGKEVLAAVSLRPCLLLCHPIPPTPPHTRTRVCTHTHTHTHTLEVLLAIHTAFQAQAHCLALGHPEGRGSGKNLMEVVYSEGDSRRQTCGVGRVTQGKSQDECMFP